MKSIVKIGKIVASATLIGAILSGCSSKEEVYMTPQETLTSKKAWIYNP